MTDVGHVLDDVLFKVDMMFFLKMMEVLLLIDVDEVNDVTDVMLILLPAVLDDQGDVEVNLCDLL